MSSQVYRVRLGSSIMLPTGKRRHLLGGVQENMLVAGEIIPAGLFGEAELRRLEDEKWIERATVNAADLPDTPVANPNGVRDAPPLPTDMSGENGAQTPESKTVNISGGTRAHRDAAPPAQPAAVSRPSQWVLDPKDLKNKRLDTLNSMIQDRTPEGQEFEPMQTKEEAIAFLSQDFSQS